MMIAAHRRPVYFLPTPIQVTTRWGLGRAPGQIQWRGEFSTALGFSSRCPWSLHFVWLSLPQCA